MVVIVMKAVVGKGGKMKPEWEEMCAVSCAVQNLHLQLAAHSDDGYGGFWDYRGSLFFSTVWYSSIQVSCLPFRLARFLT